MLKPAILYKDEIQKKMQEYFYSTDMMYETGCLSNWCPEIFENPSEGHFQYAIVDNDKCVGILMYQVDYYADRAYNFGLFSFDRGNITVGLDVHNKLEELVKRHHRVEWRAVDGNPACKAYDRFIKRHNGNKIVLKDAIRDKDGNWHNDLIYEVVKEQKNDN